MALQMQSPIGPTSSSTKGQQDVGAVVLVVIRGQ
jgi:hypothetical protein